MGRKYVFRRNDRTYYCSSLSSYETVEGQVVICFFIEIMPVDAILRNLILEKAPIYLIREKSVKNGMVTLREKVLARVLDGSSTVEEFLRAMKD